MNGPSIIISGPVSCEISADGTGSGKGSWQEEICLELGGWRAAGVCQITWDSMFPQTSLSLKYWHDQRGPVFS